MIEPTKHGHRTLELLHTTCLGCGGAVFTVAGMWLHCDVASATHVAEVDADGEYWFPTEEVTSA